MKGILKKTLTEWTLSWTTEEGLHKLPVHPHQQDELQASITTMVNNDGREVDFEIEDFYETGLEQPYQVARLIN